MLLHPLVKALIQCVSPCLFRAVRQLHADGFCGGHGLRVVGDGTKVHTGILLHGIYHSQARPAGGQVHFLAHPLRFIGTQKLLGGGGDQSLGNVHHPVEIRECLIQLHGGKLRIVLGDHALVAEDAADFVHPVHSSHNQPL